MRQSGSFYEEIFAATPMKTALVRRAHGVSIAHAQIQRHLKTIIPTLILEHSMGRRRADAVWEQKKVVFEIQLSPLATEEAVQRSQDYISYGYTVVWILHDGTFNQMTLSPAEKMLRHALPTYFTDGHQIYDQHEIIEGKHRRYRGNRLPVDITTPLSPLVHVPNRSWPLHFRGDLHTLCINQGSHTLPKRRTSKVRWWLAFLGYRLLERTASS